MLSETRSPSSPAAPAKSDVLAVTDLTDGQWNKAIDALLADGTVTRTGAKHGTRYHLKDQDEQ